MSKGHLRGGALSRKRVRLLAGAAVFGVGMTATLLIGRWAGEAAHRNEMLRLEQNGHALVESVRIAMNRVESRVAAVAAFTRFFDDVTQEDFEQFVGELGLLEGLAGFGYAPLIEGDDLDAYLARMRTTTPGYEVFGVDTEGNRVPVTPHIRYLPLEVFAPAEAFGTPPRGLDLLSEPVRRGAATETMNTRAFSVTPMIQLLGEDEADGLIVFGAVFGDDGEVQGVVTAPVNLTLLLESQVPAHLRGTLNWRIRDLADLGAADSLNLDPVVWEDLVAVGSRVWRVTVTAIPGPGGNAPLADPRFSVSIGIAGSLISALLVVLWLQRVQVKAERALSVSDSNTKNRFLASVSHELRTPLTAVIGFLDQATEPAAGTSPAVREMLTIAYDQAVEMEHIVEDLLVVARIDDFFATAESQPFEMGAEVAQVVAGFAPEIQAHIRCEGSGTAVADPARTRQIIRNLVTNASIHGTPPIEVAVIPGRDSVRLQVRDHGDGVDRQHRDRLFEPYATFHQSSTAPHSLGIGLWLSRRLARLMGGDLTYDQDGDGPVFELTLPLAHPTRPVTPPRPARGGPARDHHAPGYERLVRRRAPAA